MLTGFIPFCSAQSFRPAVSLFASRYAGKAYTGSRMHHPGAEFALYAGKKNLEPMIRFSIGRVSGEDVFAPDRLTEKPGFKTDFRALAAGFNYGIFKERRLSPQFRLSAQLINFLPRDFNQRTIPVQRNISTGLQYGLGIRYRLGQELALQVNWEYCRVFSQEFSGRKINDSNGYSLLSLCLIMGNKSD